MSLPARFLPQFKTSFIDLMIPVLFLIFLAILVPTNSIGSNGIMLVFFFILWREPELRQRWWKLVQLWVLLVLLYFCVMGTYSYSWIVTLHDAGAVLRGIGLSVVALYLVQLSEIKLRQALQSAVLILVVAISAIMAFSLYRFGFDKIIASQSGLDWVVNRNRLAVGISLTFVLTIALMITETCRRKYWLWAISIAMICFAAFLNGSRGAILGMAVALLCIMLSGIIREGWRKVLRIELLIMAVLLGFVGVAILFHDNFYIHALKEYFLHGNSVDNGRLAIWQFVLERMEQSPWIGYGPHAIALDTIQMSYGPDHFTHPHSIYIGLFYASGIVGVIFWLVWFWTLMTKVRQNFTAENNVAFYLGIGVLAMILVHGLTDFRSEERL